jgi:hypothetical protein
MPTINGLGPERPFERRNLRRVSAATEPGPERPFERRK